jgi:photosystem II stability/assembly factor-like uncharacterized protein
VRTLHQGRSLAFLSAIAATIALGGGLATASPDPEPARVRENLYASKALASGTAWRVGAFGMISRTTDAGRTWQTLPSKTQEQLFSVDFANEHVGWVVGRAGLIMYTSDGGDTWTLQASGTKNHLFAVRALSPTEAWAVGDWGAILQTTDGGKTWRDRSLQEDVILNGMSWVDPQHGWIVGEIGAVYRTEDGGAHWTKQVSGSEKSLFDVHFADLQRGWAVGLDGLLLRTVDGGVTWDVLRGNPAVGSLDAMGFLEALKGAGLYAVDVEGDFGIAAGDLGVILVTRDGGATWQQEDVPSEWRLRWIRGLSLAKGKNGLLVGSTGLTVPVVDGVLKYPGK